jgi:hypothetical protein
MWRRHANAGTNSCHALSENLDAIATVGGQGVLAVEMPVASLFALAWREARLPYENSSTFSTCHRNCQSSCASTFMRGTNTLIFGDPTDYVPDLDRVVIAPGS